MSRLTVRAEEDGVKAVWYGERDVFLEGEIGYAEADKLSHYGCKFYEPVKKVKKGDVK